MTTLVIPKSKIMTYKTKSLLYFFSFVIAATAYYMVEQHEDFNAQLKSKEVAESHFDEDLELQEPGQDLLDKMQ